MRFILTLMLIITLSGCGGDTIVSPEPEKPLIKKTTDCGNELPENCEEEETHNEL